MTNLGVQIPPLLKRPPRAHAVSPVSLADGIAVVLLARLPVLELARVNVHPMARLDIRAGRSCLRADGDRRAVELSSVSSRRQSRHMGAPSMKVDNN